MGKEDSRRPESPDNPTSRGTATTVDLGEDLLAKTKTAAARPVPTPPASASDEFHSAQILINEGLIEDAKRLLRKILISDPTHAPARQRLKELLDGELKELLSGANPPVRPRLFERKGKQARSEPESGGLEQELEQEAPPAPRFTGDYSEAKAADRMDLGIAFLEMGLNDAAIEHFRAALDLLRGEQGLDREGGPARRIAATALLARAWVAANQPFEAIRVLHPLVRDSEIPPSEKIELLYLMGIAQGMASGRKAALPWFEKVSDIDPEYRDISERLRKPIE